MSSNIGPNLPIPESIEQQQTSTETQPTPENVETVNEQPPSRPRAASNGFMSNINSIFRSAMSLTQSAATEVSRMANDVTEVVIPARRNSATSNNTNNENIDDKGKPIPIFRKRPTWNNAFSTAMKVVKTAGENIPRDIQSLRLLTDVGVPAFILPWDVECFMCISPPGEWVFPKLTWTQRMFLEKKPGPTEGLYILYIHGGAFCCCNTATHREMLFRMVQYTKANILAVDYKRPPEYPFPSPIMDCLHAYRWLLSKVDPSRIVFAGDSAGGGLVINTIVEAVKQGLPAPAGSILISPWVDLEDVTSDSWTRNKEFDFIPTDFARIFAEAYKGNKTYKEVSVTYLDGLECLPPMLVEVGECEVLHDQIMEFVVKCRDKGVKVECNVRRDMCHVFPIYAFTNMAECTNSFIAMNKFCQQVVPAVHVPKEVTKQEECISNSHDSNDDNNIANNNNTANSENEQGEPGKWN